MFGMMWFHTVKSQAENDFSDICYKLFSLFFFLYHCSLCRVELVVQFPARGSTQVLLCLFPDGLWLWHFLYSVGPYPFPSLHINTFVVSRAFMAGVASQAGDADSSRAPGLTSGLHESVNVHRGALLLVPQWQCISSFVIYCFVHGRELSNSWFTRSFLNRSAHKSYKIYKIIQNIWFPLPPYSILQLPKTVSPKKFSVV